MVGEPMTEINLTVLGTPIPQGSMRGFAIPGKNGARPRAIVTSDNKATKPWKQEIGWAAKQVMQAHGNKPFEGMPVSMSCAFYFDKPKSVKAEAKITRPDIDKLARAVLDALTGVVFKDDSQVTHLNIWKAFDSQPRVEISVLTGTLECT
jgi:Holliday junction resolvase RusA-like endonuclease